MTIIKSDRIAAHFSRQESARRLRGPVIALVVCGLFLVTAPLDAALSSANVAALAVYVAQDNSNDKPDSMVIYNITLPSLIDAILSGIEFDVQRDCSDLDAKNNSFLYVKLKDGSRKVYDLFLLNSHAAIRGRRDFCFAISAEAQVQIVANAQP
jgi:hypothetical protein